METETRTITFPDNISEPLTFECYKGTDIICTPGQFECEPLYVPYFNAYLMNGSGEPVGEGECDNTERLEIEQVDRDNFPGSPELRRATHIDIYQNDQGFIQHTLINNVLGGELIV